ncbi:NAD(P)/FAD-dependent oxidoreductase [Algoriphagus namhaensis]
MKIDFLLIGQGLAGSILGYRLLKAGKTLRIIDQPASNRSSRIAAGLYNPITGRKMVKTWWADLLFPAIQPLYRELESVTKRYFLEETDIYRPFLTIEEQNEWMGKSAEEAFSPYVRQVFQNSRNSAIQDPFGGVLLKNSGWLNTVSFLDAMQDYFGESLIQDKFDESKLAELDSGWNYDGQEYSALIFANGLGAMETSFFDFLPFAPVKGEILELSQNFTPDYIVNRGVFRVSISEKIHRVGSTYTKHDLDRGVTEDAKKELLERLADLIHEPVKEVLSHKFGIRPATRDRKPFLGKHPDKESVYCFNGFGAKGVSLIPYLSQVMVDYLLGKRGLEKEVDIARYFNYI